jgi:hypothetical protein
LKLDGILIFKNHLCREELVKQIYDTAKENQHIVIGSPPATRKTSLLQLLRNKLEREGASVIRIDMNGVDTVKSLKDQMAEYGIMKQSSKLQLVKNTWLLLDDAQNAYGTKFHPFWQFVMEVHFKCPGR